MIVSECITQCTIFIIVLNNALSMHYYIAAFKPLQNLIVFERIERQIKGGELA